MSARRDRLRSSRESPPHNQGGPRRHPRIMTSAISANDTNRSRLHWYARDPTEIAEALGVDPSVGLTSQEAARRLERDGPNALPEEKPKPGWRRFIDEYRTYMQLILIGAAIVSMAIQEWSTAILLVALTILNAVVGLRQEGKAESAMNALKSMMKVTARVRRDGVVAEIPAEDVVVGDTAARSQPGTRSPPTAESSRRPHCRSTNRRSRERASRQTKSPPRSPKGSSGPVSKRMLPS